MEALRESFLNLTFQMSLYKRATLDEEDLVDSTGDDIYPSSPMQVNSRHPVSKNKQKTYKRYAATTQASGGMYQPCRVSLLPSPLLSVPTRLHLRSLLCNPEIFYRIRCCFLGLGLAQIGCLRTSRDIYVLLKGRISLGLHVNSTLIDSLQYYN